MTKARRNRARRGKHLLPCPAVELLEMFPYLKAESRRLRALGFRLRDTIRPYRRRDGRITIVFVWIRRHGDETTTMTTTIRHVVRAGHAKALS